jgi:hypothetical protein
MVNFPGVGHKYDVRFSKFHVHLYFESEVSMTYWSIDAGGNETGAETVTTLIKDLGNSVYLVTWQEAGGEAVVHIEDFGAGQIHTHIVWWDPATKTPQLMTDHGPFVQI